MDVEGEGRCATKDECDERDAVEIQMAVVFRIDRFASLSKVPVLCTLVRKIVHFMGPFYTLMKISQNYFP